MSFKFAYNNDCLFYGEAEVDLIDNPAFIKDNKNKVTFWGLGYDEMNLTHSTRTMKPTKLNDALERFKVGQKIGFTVDGKKQAYIIQSQEICLLESEYISKRINPYNYTLTLYVYPVDMEDPKDRKYIYVTMDFGEEEETDQDELKNLFN